MKRATKASTFNASISSTSQTTIVVFIIIDPFPTAAIPLQGFWSSTIALISEYPGHRCSIPHDKEWRRFAMLNKRDE
jgi:hypothetical protein